jgi:hypothetical protein
MVGVSESCPSAPVHAGLDVFLQRYPLPDDATVEYMIASSEDVVEDGHESSNWLPQYGFVLASLRHIQMNSIRDMAPHEASLRAYLDRMPFMASSSRLSRMSRWIRSFSGKSQISATRWSGLGSSGRVRTRDWVSFGLVWHLNRNDSEKAAT